MIHPKDLFGSISGGKVLDVATGSGGFISFLLEGLNDWTEITGIDTNERAAAAFAQNFQETPGIHFVQMDALHMEFPDGAFDTVCISNSLHHFDDPQAVLREMTRVLRPGGHLILSEMYCDDQTATQMTHVHLHHWWAAVDRANGVVHHETYRRAQLIDLLSGWADLTLYDLADTGEDPKAPELQAEFAPIFDRYLQRAAGHPELQARGEELRQRVAEIGFHSATTLVAMGTKPA